jgi:predicted MFS family arabinose efflux permease
LATNIWLCYLAYAVGVGLGGACCYLPALAITGGWFVRHRNTALGIAAAGTGCGTLVLPPLAAALIQLYGWRATNVIFGLAAGIVLLGCAIAVAPPPIAWSVGNTGQPLKAVFGSHSFLMLYLSWVLATTALFVPFVFLPAFARDHGASEVAAAALVSAIGGASVLGRLVMSPLGNRLGVLPLFKLTVLMMAASMMAAKNSRKRIEARSPAAAMNVGSVGGTLRSGSINRPPWIVAGCAPSLSSRFSTVSAKRYFSSAVIPFSDRLMPYSGLDCSPSP